MPINNTDIISPLMSFSSPDDFYFLQIIQRAKDNTDNQLFKANRNSRIIKDYYINSIEYFNKHIPEIISLCNTFNARACIRLNKRSYKKCAYMLLSKLSNSLLNNELHEIKSLYSSVCGENHSDKNKTWIIDIDKEDMPQIQDISKYISELNNAELQHAIPSKSGYHLITRPFNCQLFSLKFPSVEIHKDNPTNLYIP